MDKDAKTLEQAAINFYVTLIIVKNAIQHGINIGLIKTSDDKPEDKSK